MSDFNLPGTIPELPTTPGGEVVYQGSADKWRITNVKAGAWVVHRARDHSYEGELFKDGAGFEYSYRAGTASAMGTYITYSELFSKFLG